MSIVIISNSLLTTVQDSGRGGFRRFGVNTNGAMDKTVVRLINILLENDENEAVLEMHFPAPKILFGGVSEHEQLQCRQVRISRILNCAETFYSTKRIPLQDIFSTVSANCCCVKLLQRRTAANLSPKSGFSFFISGLKLFSPRNIC